MSEQQSQIRDYNRFDFPGVTLLRAEQVEHQYSSYEWHEVLPLSQIGFDSNVPQMLECKSHSAKVRLVELRSWKDGTINVSTRKVAILDDDVNAVWDNFEKDIADLRSSLIIARTETEKLRVRAAEFWESIRSHKCSLRERLRILFTGRLPEALLKE